MREFIWVKVLLAGESFDISVFQIFRLINSVFEELQMFDKILDFSAENVIRIIMWQELRLFYACAKFDININTNDKRMKNALSLFFFSYICIFQWKYL